MVSIPDPFSRNRFKNPDKIVMSQTERYVCTQTERYVCRYYLKQNLVWKICIFITDKQLAWRMTAASTLNNTRLNKIPITNIYIWNIRFWKYYKFSLHKSYFFKLLVFPFHFLFVIAKTCNRKMITDCSKGNILYHNLAVKHYFPNPFTTI